MKKIKGFSYDTESDRDVIEHIQKQPLQANYIWNLVRQDMNKIDDIEELVKKYVKQYCKDLKIDTTKITPTISRNNISDLLKIGK